jgi:hypothetical protein
LNEFDRLSYFNQSGSYIVPLLVACWQSVALTCWRGSYRHRLLQVFMASMSHCSQRLLQIGFNIVKVLNADRRPR